MEHSAASLDRAAIKQLDRLATSFRAALKCVALKSADIRAASVVTDADIRQCLTEACETLLNELEAGGSQSHETEQRAA